LVFKDSRLTDPRFFSFAPAATTKSLKFQLIPGHDKILVFPDYGIDILEWTLKDVGNEVTSKAAKMIVFVEITIKPGLMRRAPQFPYFTHSRENVKIAIDRTETDPRYLLTHQVVDLAGSGM
jgi:hypothetical protein